MLCHISELPSYLRPNNIPLYKHTTLYSSIDQVMDILLFPLHGYQTYATVNIHVWAFV